MTVSTFSNRAQKQKIENKIRWKTGYEYLSSHFFLGKMKWWSN